MEGEVRQRRVFGSGYVIGEFVCPPTSERWRVENEINDGPLFVFPSVPVEIDYRGHGAVLADPNQVLFYNDAQRYRRRLIDRRGDRCIFVRLDPEDLREVLLERGIRASDDPAAPFDFQRTASRADNYLRHLALARYVFRSERRDDLLVHESLLMLLRDSVSRAPEGSRENGARRRRGREAVHASQLLLSTRFPEELTLRDIAESAELSPFHLARLFREHLGMTVHGYREQLRLIHGLSRLLEGERLIDVALDAGYSSHSHFTHAFRRMFRRSPSEVRTLLSASDRDLAALSALLRRTGVCREGAFGELLD